MEFYSEPEIGPSNIIRLLLQKGSYKSNKISKREMKKLILIIAGISLISKGGTDTFCQEPGGILPGTEAGVAQNFHCSASLFSKLTEMDARLLAIGRLPINLIKLKNKEYRKKSSLETKMLKVGIVSKGAD